jgi:hypothetical protein
MINKENTQLQEVEETIVLAKKKIARLKATLVERESELIEAILIRDRLVEEIDRQKALVFVAENTDKRDEIADFRQRFPGLCQWAKERDELSTRQRWEDLSDKELNDMAISFMNTDPCRGCGQPLISTNIWITDGCPCNSPRGINHGLVAKNTCVCSECDPEQTGSTRNK